MGKESHPAQTSRQAIQEVLEDYVLTAREISARVGVAEKEVVKHLEHLERSVSRQGGRFVVEPARCAACGFEFVGRERFSKPSKCPQCKKTRIEAPRFTVNRG